MSGIEPVTGVVGAAAKAVAKAVDQDAKEADVLLRIGEGSGALDEAAKIAARRAAVKQQIRLKLWQPLAMLFKVSSDYFETDFEREMADRLSDVPEEDVITPRLSVAGPTVQGISFTVEEPELKSMYLNLLAKASDRRAAGSAHPSFAEIIRQLNAEEAELLGGVLAQSQIALVQVKLRQPGRDGYTLLVNHLCQVVNRLGGQIFRDEFAVYIDNWVRLGLVRADYSQHLVHEGAYDWVQENPKYKILQQQHDSGDEKAISFGPGVLFVTEFGKLFYRVVIEQPQPARAVDEEPGEADLGAGGPAPQADV